MTEKTKVYITRYALTDGIYEEDAVISERGSARCGMYSSYNVGEFFHTLEEAKLDAEKRRLKKINSIKKQLEKLEKTRF